MPGGLRGPSPRASSEAGVAVLPAEPGCQFGDLPAAPSRLQVVHREQAPPGPADQSGQPGGSEADRTAETRNFYRFLCVSSRPAGVVFREHVGTVDHVTSPSRRFLRTGGVSLGRCGSTGPAVFPGDRAVGYWLSSRNVAFLPMVAGSGAYAHAQRKRTQRVQWNGRVLLSLNRRLARRPWASATWDREPIGSPLDPVVGGSLEDGYPAD